MQGPEGDFLVPAQRVKAVDGTGASASFAAGFLSRFVRGASLTDCMRAGMKAGARAVTKIGGTTAFE